jgi:hypothetical protein
MKILHCKKCNKNTGLLQGNFRVGTFLMFICENEQGTFEKFLHILSTIFHFWNEKHSALQDENLNRKNTICPFGVFVFLYENAFIHFEGPGWNLRIKYLIKSGGSLARF